MIRLKEFSKKCESFLFVEVINTSCSVIRYANGSTANGSNGWTGHTETSWAVSMVTSSIS